MKSASTAAYEGVHGLHSRVLILPESSESGALTQSKVKFLLRNSTTDPASRQPSKRVLQGHSERNKDKRLLCRFQDDAAVLSRRERGSEGRKKNELKVIVRMKILKLIYSGLGNIK